MSPDWQDLAAVRQYLATLPRPLWVSAYGGYAMSPSAYAQWVKTWLPDDAHLLYQDGVGVGKETVESARAKADALAAALGSGRVSIVLEAFRQDSSGFGSASVPRILRQLRAYRGLSIYAFSTRQLGWPTVFALKLLAPLAR
jgi:hypothetical protein